jgi:geranylgeranylglycerol-phosphate geranylgeranyltransferase
MVRFVLAYLRSMRLYFSFVTGIAGWIGVSFYDFCMPGGAGLARKGLILTLLFLSYGVNQVINDYYGLKEDRINAPHRPMVTGELNPRLALLLSVSLLAVVGIVSWFLAPLAVIPVAAGVLLNLLYEYAKAWSLLGNAVFGLSIAMCTAYGFLASGPPPDPLFTSNRICVFLLVALLNALMTYYTYFKDYKGDRAAGKRTFIVKYGLRVARYVGVVGAFFPTLAFFSFHAAGWLPMGDILFRRDFIFCGMITLFLQLWTAILFFRHPIGERTYFSLVTNVRACVAGQVTLIAIFNGTLALYLLSASYVFIGFLFDLYKDARS